MSRTETASSMKGGPGRRGDRPPPDSNVGKLLAALMCGEFVSVISVLKDRHSNGFALESLRSSYGMEIETRRGKNGGARLLGEWDGPYFVPIERMDPYPEKVVD